MALSRDDVFQDRYGEGARTRLMALFRQPCVTFAQIADQFGVSRERVRQWHLEILPDAPRGRERRRLCGRSQHRRQLLGDPLFRAFYRHARPSFSRDRLQLIPSGDGFRKRMVTLDGSTVVLKTAGKAAGSTSGRADNYYVAGYRGPARFVYCRLSDDDFLFMPASFYPATGRTVADSPRSKYQMFRNTFAALTAAVPARTESARTAQGAGAAWVPTPPRCAGSSE
jgi:hypothetical protein